MNVSSWLCPTELDRSRVIDANDRVRTIRLIGSTAVGAALVLCAPWIGWWTLGLFALSALNFINVGRRIHKSPHPELVSVCAIVITLLLIGGGVVISGGPHSPALPWMVLPAGMVAARFRPQVVIAALVLTIALILVTTLGVDPGWTIHDPVPLIATLALLAGVVSIVWALQGAELHHRDEAILDPLTGLLNRHALEPRFVEISHQARLSGQPVCLVLCDVDGFKAINDEHGHDRGDAALRDIAYELRKRLRSFELVYRLGGEEFLIVLPGVDLQAGHETAERLRAAVEQAQPTGIPITISLGVSAAGGAQVIYNTLFKAADEALYAAKRTGRNRVIAAPGSGSGLGSAGSGSGLGSAGSGSGSGSGSESGSASLGSASSGSGSSSGSESESSSGSESESSSGSESASSESESNSGSEPEGAAAEVPRGEEIKGASVVIKNLERV